MSQLIEGVYKQDGQADQVLPILVDEDGMLLTSGSGGASGGLTDTELRASPVPVSLSSGNVTITGPVTVSNEVEIKNDSGSPIPVAGSAAVGTAPTSPPLSISGVDGSGNKRHIKTDTSGNVGIYGAATRTSTNAVILSGQSTSGVIDLLNTSILGFYAPAAWTTAGLVLQTSPDGVGSWSTAIIDGSNTQVGVWSSITAGNAYSVDVTNMLAWRYVRLLSGTAVLPVNQAADRTFVVVTRPTA